MFATSLPKSALLGALMTFTVTAAAQNNLIAPSPNGITLPKDYKNWQVFGVSHRTDKNSLRLILANDVAAKAAEDGQTNPWPDGSKFAKLAWKDSLHPQFPAATVPGELAHVEVMIRDVNKYASTQGWGFARWLGMAQKPYGNDAGFANECAACHLQAKDNGYVFTRKAPLP